MQDIILLAEILDKVVNPDIDGENLKRARGEATLKIKRLYMIFDIAIEDFKVKGKYHINKEYEESIKWILYYGSTYENRDKEIEKNRDVSTEAMEMFVNGDFNKISAKELERIVVHMVDGLMAFNTIKLSSEKRIELQHAIQKIYMCTRLYHRQLEKLIQDMFETRDLLLDDKIIVYNYLSEIIGGIGRFINKLVNELVDYRQAEDNERAFKEFDKLTDGMEVSNTITMQMIENMVFEDSIQVLKTIIGDIEEERKVEVEEEKVEDYVDLGKWLKENNYDFKVSVNKNDDMEGENETIDDLEFELYCYENRLDFLKEEFKRSHYTKKRKDQIKKEIDKLKKEQSIIKKRLEDIRG